MSWIDFIQTFLLLFITERLIWQRPRYRLVWEVHKKWTNSLGGHGFGVSLWINRQDTNGGPYMRDNHLFTIGCRNIPPKH